jgi:hypothetical protein
MASPKQSRSADSAAAAPLAAADFGLNELMARDSLGRIREALDSFEEDDLHTAANIISDEMKDSRGKFSASLQTEELRSALLNAAERMDLKTRVRVAERLSQVGYSRLGKVAS